MNSQLYRIVFNRSRGVSVAVAEFAKTCGKGRRNAAMCWRGEGARPRPAGRYAAAMAMLAALGLGVPMGINAAIIADASAPQNQQPTVAVTANGTPQANIQTPSAAGVSRNTYIQFDVDGRGAILNNSACNTQTQIGGWVQGNPNLVHGSARIILNEVNSSLPSRLNGYVEVAGSRAEVVIANPSGISVNGGGFINASRATLTTGTPLMYGGDLKGYSVEQGTVRIEGAGLDLAQTDYAAILARAVEVNAGVWAEQLKVIAGANHIDAGHDQITPVPAGVSQYVYALDVAHLGGMYAGKITLVGTEAGLGMRNAGEINAASGSLMLAADGMLSNTGTMSARHTVVTVAGLENRGLIDGQETHIHAASLTNVGGGRIYGDRVAIAAHTLVNDAESVGGEIRAAVIAARDRLDIGAGTIRNREQSALFSAGDLHVGGTLDADGHAVGSADELHNTSAFIESLGNMVLSTTGLYNTNEHYTAEVRRIAGPSSVSWSSGNFQYSVTRSEYRTTVVEGRPGQILAGGDMHITGSVLFNDKSLILAGGSLGGDLDRLQNIDAQGVHVVSDSGYSRYRYEQCVIYWPWPASGCAYSESRWSSWVPYNPADRVTSVSLNIANTAEHTAVAGTGTALPGLYTVNLANPGTPVIEADPRFADYRTWLGSDYMLAALELEPTGVLRRLGDGFYEQRLIRDQIAAQTGQRYLAGHDNDGAGGETVIDAGRDILLGTVTVGRQDNTVWNAVTHVKKGHSQDAGTEIAVAGDVRLRAGNDVAATAGQVVSRDGELSVTAGNDIRLQAGQASEMSDIAYQDTSYSLFSSKTTTIRDAHADTRAVGSTLSAERVDMLVGRNMDISGSQVVASRDVSLRAQGDITIASASDTSEEVHFKDVSESGLFSGGGLSVTYGTRQQSTDAQSRQLTAARSTVGSLDGQVQIEAGGRYEQQGSDVLAPQGDIDITARDIAVLTTEEHASTRLENRYRQTGVTLTLTSPLITALETGQRMARAARETGDDRLKILAASAAGFAAYDAYVQYHQNPAQAGGLNISLSLGTSQSASTTVQTRQGAAGSGIAAGRDVRLSARRSEEQGGDILIVGSGVSAGNDASLQADNDIHLLAAQDIHTRQSSNNSSGASVGIGFRVGGQSNGFTLNIGLNEGRGQADGTDILHTHSQIQAGNTANVHSGGDTTLKGAVVEGRQVIAQVGGDLTIESVQDTSTYDSKQSSSGIGVSLCIPPFCYGTSSGSVNMSDSRAQGAYASVTAQSGIKAGDGGFDIEVANDTTLIGGVIASSEQAVEEGHNRLTTGTLVTEDLTNHATASAEASGLSLGTDVLTQGRYGIAKAIIANTALDAERQGSSSGRTKSAIGEGEIVITDNEKQQQLTGHSAEETVAMFNRDTDTAHTAAQKQDAQQMQRTVEAERAIKMEAFEQLKIHVTDVVYRADNAEKKIVLTRDCGNAADCEGQIVIDPDNHVFVQGPDGNIYIFNNGINNTEEEAVANAVKQHGQTAHEAGIYTVINPHTGNIVTEAVYASLDKLRELTGWTWLLGASNTALARNDLVDAVTRHNEEAARTGGQILKIVEVSHSRGSLTSSNATQVQVLDGKTNVPIGTILFNGAAANAERMAGRIEQVTGGQGEVLQSTHRDDFVGEKIGGNETTGGNPVGFSRAHRSYGPGVPYQDRINIWGNEQGSVAKEANPTSQEGKE